jgi:hypothetical protein
MKSSSNEMYRRMFFRDAVCDKYVFHNADPHDQEDAP